ncbi:MAG: hypothetical protein COZ06_00010 [Armatimonadetes bacterium CG_4_10_14_3_um_filter_66_18]|nr:MAG: hypothetical protein AUJ96_19195 [Armatimonadetes bacterium CG2_30_66_41]PIX43725.1 MAG: hypothetical protein COZ57_18680 [Armatimonadetes bacterium CG_4_8_14_3_um_filter_66_20]PIY54451.1 MAG: hypothetical protein COZ06_00010 [Armatimonadetes bacterium CG_4_10_14_3_um_filter_66_18]PIZ45084.1 MAG: hypothetical protein COY42_12895 [Armatimonadetes bacterium CG_4_10_14_0_8_um_filter_66_14]
MVRTRKRVRAFVASVVTTGIALLLVGPLQLACGPKKGTQGAGEQPNTPEQMKEMMKKGGGDQAIPPGKGQMKGQFGGGKAGQMPGGR